ncbi:WEB family protein At3g51220 [Lycium barbarum]|uniref:WEB family protein At3g51220 n=1 Tax=Lycium barbarum TaxID=112863 RepID=UPI00293F7883|nr:WEB family protein At3g51220 [Lycium barbarum]
MEITPKLSPPPMDYHSNVDSSRPFRSVKEAVAIFGERFLVKEIYSPKPFTFPTKESPSNNSYNYSPRSANSQEIVASATSWKSASSPSPQDLNNNDPLVVEALKKLESELEETKTELKLMKARESETEIALASLNAELHKNMSKLAQAEAAHAGAMAASKSVKINNEDYGNNNRDKKKEMKVRWESPPTLSEILTIEETDLGLLGKKKEKKKTMKKKPIIPLVGDLFSRKKKSSTTVDNPLFASSHLF